MRNEELFHHGIKGQKWGVRRDEKELALNAGKFPISVLQERIAKLDLNTKISTIMSKGNELPKAFVTSIGTAAGVSLAAKALSKARRPLWSFLKSAGKAAGKAAGKVAGKAGRVAGKVAKDTIDSLRGR